MANFPLLQNSPYREDEYLRDPYIRLEGAPSEAEAAWTKALEVLATRELARGTADAELKDAEKRASAAVKAANSAKAVVEVAQARLQKLQSTFSDPADVAEANAALQNALNFQAKADARRVLAGDERVQAAKAVASAETKFSDAAKKEVTTRNSRREVVKSEFRGDPALDGIPIQRGTLLVRFRDEAPIDAIKALLDRYELDVTSGFVEISLFVVALRPSKRIEESEIEHVLRLKRTADTLAKEKAIVFSATPHVTLSSYHPGGGGSPPAFSGRCWEWYDAAPNGAESAVLIHLREAWTFLEQNRPAGGAAVPVAVLDTHFSSHNDLPNLVPICQGISGVHGTQVAGMIHGTSGNGRVPAGSNAVAVISTCGSKAVAGTSVGDRNVAFTKVIDTLTKLLDKGQRVVNVSLGYNWRRIQVIANTRTLDVQPIVRAQGAMIRDLLSRHVNDVVVVSAAGNECDRLDCPDDGLWTSPFNWARIAPRDPLAAADPSPNVVVIESVLKDGAITVASNRSNIAAPGFGLLTCLSGTTFGLDAGTSIAAPVISGVVAMMLAQNSNLKPVRIVSILESRIGANDVINAVGAVEDAQREVRREAADLTHDGIIDWADFVVFRRELRKLENMATSAASAIDLNDDHEYGRTKASPVRGFASPKTDLQILQEFWEDPNVKASELEALLDQ